MHVPAALPATDSDFLPQDGLAEVLLTISLTGVLLLRPIYAADAVTIIDLDWVRLNPAAQRLLGLPERPIGSFLTLFPAASEVGVFPFYRDAFLSGRVERRQNLYQHDALDGYYDLVAQRCADLLVVSFTDGNDQPRTAVEEALRASQAREQTARAEAERQRNRWQALVDQAPVALGLFEGPELRITAANHLMSRMWGRPQAEVQGQPLLAALPELQGQGFEALMRQVYETRVPFAGTEAPAEMLRDGQLTTFYYNFVYQPLYDEQGEVLGLLSVAVEVTEQVLARRLVEEKERQTYRLNEELQAANAEIRANNAELVRTQQQLRALNEGLETRVTERTQQLADQQALLRQILRQVPAYVATFSGLTHVYSFFNETFSQVFAKGRARLGATFAEVFPELVTQGFVAVLDGVYTSGQAFRVPEAKLVQRDPLTQQERTNYVDVVYQPLHDAQGQPQGILAFGVDTTAQVLARQQVQELNEQLTAALHAASNQQAQLQSLFEQAPVAICLLRSPALVIELANPGMEAIWGRPPAPLIGLPLFEALPEAAGQGFEAILSDVLTTGQPFVRRAGAFTVSYADGSTAQRSYDCSYEPLRDAQGAAVGILCVALDVTDENHSKQQVLSLNAALSTTNAELSESNRRLLRTNADLDNFIYTASHDLKAPISNIEGLLRLLEDMLPAALRTDDTLLPVLNRMQDAVERFTRTIGHLTEVSKLQLEFAHPAAPTPLAPLVDDVRQDLAPLLAETGGQLAVDVATCPTLLFSEKNLRSLLYNLVSNALKYRHPDRPPVVRLSCHFEAGRPVLRVQDNGLGLSEAQQAKLFQLFSRLHTHVEGTGVGLYMVKKMVENAHGTLTVESREGEGTTFTASFPA